MDLDAALVSYCAQGWRVLPVRGKVPLGDGWPDRATSDIDDALRLFATTPHDGVGVLLGQRSGIIDLECDSPEAEETISKLFDGAIPPTPTFRSSRGLHRLFAWTEGLPPSEANKAKFVVGGLEIRAGAGNAQSVLPPSGAREWVIHPDDAKPAEIPVRVLVRLTALVEQAKQAKRPTAQPYQPTRHDGEALDVGRWLARRGVEVLRHDAHGDVRRWFIPCPRIAMHSTADGVRDCVITQEIGSGRLGGHCFHASCQMNDWQALSGAIGKPERIDYHPDEPAPQALPPVDISGIVGPRLAEIVDEDEVDDAGEEIDAETGSTFPAECLAPDGLLGEIMDHTLCANIYPQPELALAAAIAFVGTITGRKVTDATRTRTNVYVLGLGLSGCGKEAARQTNKRLAMLAGGEALMGSERVGSHAGIVTTVHDQPACLMQLDEMGRLLETMKNPAKSPHLYNCITVLMQLYSSSGTTWKADAYADAKRIKTVDQPHLCIYGTATPDSFWHSLSRENIGEGLVGRLLVFEGRGYGDLRAHDPTEDKPAQELVDAVRWWLQFQPGGNLATEHPEPRLVPHTPEARERMKSHIDAINERRRNEDNLRAAVWSRSAEKVAKLALIHACSRSRCLPETITRADVDWAVKLGNFLTRRLLVGCRDFVSENETENRTKRVLAMIPKTGIKAAALTIKTQWLRGKERTEILNDLIGAGLIEVDTIATKTKPATIYRRRSKKRAG